MLTLDSCLYPIFISYFIGNLIVSFSTISIGMPRNKFKIKDILLYSFGILFIFVLLLPVQKNILLHICLATLLNFIMLMFIFPQFPKNCAVMSIYTTTISCPAEIICILLLWKFLHLKAYDDFTGNNLFMLVGITFSNMSLLTLTAVIPPIYWILRPYIRCKESFLYCIFPIYQFVLFYICISLFDSPSAHMIIVGNIFLILGFFIDWILMFSLDNLIKRKLHQEELELLALQQKNEYECYLKIQKPLEQHRLEKHEFANQRSTIYAMVYNQASVDDIDNMISSSNCFLNSEPTYMAFDECICDRRPKQSVREARHPE